MIKRLAAVCILILLLAGALITLSSCTDEPESPGNEETQEESEESRSYTVKKNGSYNSKEDVAEYLSIYKKLPKNYITKKEAKKLGWHGGSLEPYAPGKSIGGDRFNNYEKKLPEKSGRKYYECDIDTKGRKRGPKRLIYSSDGLIYYTGDHYNSFSKMPQSAS